MKTSPNGLKLIKAHEGLRLRAYLCPAGVWTIGYGHTSAAGKPEVRPGMVITQSEADAILKADLSRFEDRVSRLVKVPLTQGQFDALVSFDFNTGALHSSTLLKRLNAGRYADVPAQLMRWTKAGGKELPGLVRRRREEAALWRSLDEYATGGRADVGEVEPPAPGKPAAESTTIWSQIAAMLTTVGTAAAQAFGAIDWKVAAVITTGAVLAFGIYTISERLRKSREDGI